MFKNSNVALAATSIAILSVAGFAGAAQMKASVSSARAAAINCTVPNNVSCTISSAKGIKSVLIKAGPAQGNVTLVDKSYNACPKQVTVTWDSAYQMGSKSIAVCSSMKIKAN